MDNDKKLLSLIDHYLEWERIESHKVFVKQLIDNKDHVTLKKIIGTRLTFGTAGIRGPMGPGFGQMNDLVIIQTAQGLVSYLLRIETNLRHRGVIIGNDARHNSSKFARLTAVAFLQKGIPVYFCDHIIPTPFVAFGVRNYNCAAGVVVTASHNPKHDNGFKVYLSNGAQLLSPHDKNIQAHIEMAENLKPWSKAWQEEKLISATQHTFGKPVSPIPKAMNQVAARQCQLDREWKELLHRIQGDLCQRYYAYLETLIDDRKESNSSANICITYTTLHGVGHMYLSRALDLAGFDEVFPVELQKKPDPEFSTVRYPNPEENGALDLAFETAKHANSNLILANDPDSDRLGAAVYKPQTNYRRILTGNEIGALLGWWIWFCYKSNSFSVTAKMKGPKQSTVASVFKDTSQDEDSDSENISQSLSSYISKEEDENPSTKPQSASKAIAKRKPSDCFMVASTVSSTFLRSMAKIEGFNFVQTLTGFKHMANYADDLYKTSYGTKKVLFAFEEALGFMVDTTVLDKDGISAAIQLAQCAAYCNREYNRNLEDQLEYLYSVYGYHYCINSYYTCTDQDKIKEIFTSLQANYPTNFGGVSSSGQNKFRVTRVRDLNNGYDSGEADKIAKLPVSSSSFMVTFFLEHDITITFRTSGTEPKIKYYSEICAKITPNEMDADKILSGMYEVDVGKQSKIKDAARRKLSRLVELAVETCLKPSKYQLIPAE